MPSKDTPEDVKYPDLYRQAQQEARQRFRVYPSAYANGWMVQRYQRLSQERHGNNGYTARQKDLGEWFRQNWVDISRPKPGGGFEPCGRATEGMSEADYRREYPKCLPAARAAQLSDDERQRLIGRKRREGLPEGGRPQQTSSDLTKERYTYNGVTATATRRRPSSRADKKYMRTVTVGDRTRLVHYGDPNLEMRRDDPERRRNFLARHNCSGKRDPFAPGFWACLDWQRTNEKEMTMPEDTDTVTMDPRTHGAVVEKGDGYDWMDKGDGYRKDDMMEYANGDGYDEGMKYAYYGVTSFAELEDIQASKMASEKVYELGEMFQGMAKNIMGDMEITDKAAALRGLVDEFQTRLDMLNPTSTTTKEQAPVEELPAEPANSLTVWKEASGAWRWLAIYSNKFRDQDNPPEIISEKSHKTFLELVDQGVVPYPELWHWHIPGTRWGVADWLAYADGFALASGTVDAGHEKEAETLAASSMPIRVSHGMPERFIVRNPGDPSVIDFHITTEISDLPSPAAANPLTGFQVFKGANEMALPAQKKQYLKQAGLSDDRIAEIENGLASRAKEAQDAGLEYKETAAPAPTEEPAVVKDATPVAEPAMTRQEVADAMSQIVTVFTQQMATLTESLTALTAEVKELRRTDADRIAEKAADTPPASLQALIAQRIIGHPDARVNKGATLAKDKPDETPAAAAGPTPYSFINALVQNSHQVAE